MKCFCCTNRARFADVRPDGSICPACEQHVSSAGRQLTHLVHRIESDDAPFAYVSGDGRTWVEA